ncbi:REF/SRPP-like protein At3g05500 [Amaranthus tricolor]|uniref:REF/SRPP-like protein At3g05500 n=1 Tax=Amaranthus tricolor TaxID=29722 RepID=UPI00258B779B|nr:REF/SRPP-like protein At3g05500 [Amaranthus tricolor]
MAESDSKPEKQMNESGEQSLKYFQFVHAATIQAIVCFSSLYGYAKDKAGPLKPGVETVEGTVKTVVRPVYDRFHDVPIELLKFVDRKVDDTMVKLQDRVPPLVKQMSCQAYSATQKAPEVARGVASEVRRVGVVDTASEYVKDAYNKYEPAAKELYSKYEPVAEQYAVSAWRKLNRLPLFPKVAEVVVPGAALCSEKYNQTVKLGAEKGYRVANYMPLVPIEKISKVFEEQKGETQTVATNENGVAAAH